MSLCGICSSIDFQNLPAFPTAEYQLYLAGLQHAQVFSKKRGTSDDAIAALSRVRHHPSLANLRTAVDNGCKLCKLILAQADALLAELQTLRPERYRNDYLPTFDMWLSQREEGGQGFCVMSSSGDQPGCARVVPVAAFGFVMGDGDRTATSIRGRPVARIIDRNSLQHFVKWNAEYEQDHQGSQDDTILPQYLLDVQNLNVGGSAKIVKLDAAPARYRYAALSYTSEPEALHYRRQSGIQEDDELSVEKLPKMFQDAIFVTHSLDIRYLWIDALCVRDESWARQSEQAGAVYEHAYLTLSASGTSTISDGLLFQRPASALVQIPQGADRNGGTWSVSAIALPLEKEIMRQNYIEMSDQPVSQDAWLFQARVLSRRTLHFASDQMYYECLHHFASEDGLIQHMRYHTSAKALPEGTEHFRRRCLDQDPRSRWCALIWDYGRCHAHADKLTALSNVARAFQRLEPDDYIAGHWKRALPDSLFWRSLSSYKSSGDRNAVAPSWSWASVDGIVSMGLGYNRVYEHCARIIDIRWTLADVENAFGSVMAAEIELEAWLVPLKLVEKPESAASGHMHVVAAEDGDGNYDRGFYAGFDTIDRKYAQSADAVREMQLFALVLMLTRGEDRPAGACGPLNSTCALIVTPANDLGVRMKRLGFLSAAERRLPYAKLGVRKIVLLV